MWTHLSTSPRKIEEVDSEPHLWRSIHCRRSHAFIENRSRYGAGLVDHRPCPARYRPVWLATWLVAVQLRPVLADACLGLCRGGRRYSFRADARAVLADCPQHSV